MSCYLYPVATALPETAYKQAEIGALLRRQLAGNRRLERLAEQIYRHSGIEKRHSVLHDLETGANEGFLLGPAGAVTPQSTGARNRRYREEAGKLFVCAARRALARCPWLAPEEVSHLITVSCTGFFAPGPDVLIVRELGLSASVQRYHLGFMGCYAAFPALELAASICRAQPEARVLIVSVELCTLHLQPQDDLDAVLSASLFADGGAAVVVSARAPQGEAALRIEALQQALAPEGEEEMAWTIGDQGFEMTLSSYVPELLGRELGALVGPLLEAQRLCPNEIPHWAVHPGGRAILDRTEAALGLTGQQLSASRQVLAEFGNMSSATVLFVLERLQRRAARGERIFGLAFGPGLSVASGLFSRA